MVSFKRDEDYFYTERFFVVGGVQVFGVLGFGWCGVRVLCGV